MPVPNNKIRLRTTNFTTKRNEDINVVGYGPCLKPGPCQQKIFKQRDAKAQKSLAKVREVAGDSILALEILGTLDPVA